uniref:Uncharacterized protein n=1 Tax=Anguilla anguilla TaxID=7936 RepID=A0A0E9UNM8_ANGAN
MLEVFPLLLDLTSQTQRLVTLCSGLGVIVIWRSRYPKQKGIHLV